MRISDWSSDVCSSDLLTYFGKPLFQLENEDYRTLETLWAECGTFDAEAAPKIAHRLKALIDDAKGVRRDTLDWIRRTEAEAKALKPGQRSEEHTSELQSLMRISYAVFCLKQKNNITHK